MPEDPNLPRGESADAGAPLLDTVARRIEQLSSAIAEQTRRLLEKSDQLPRADLAAILDAARRSSELARELVTLARLERDAAARALASVKVPSSSERSFDSVPAHSHRRVRDDVEPAQQVVLVIDDEPLLLKTMRRMLEQYGHRVHAAADPVDALAIAARERELDLVVTDLALPGMSGTALVKSLRAKRPRLRVLYTSGWDPASSGVTLLNDGSEAFLSKPFTALELDACLSELLGTPQFRRVQRG